MYEILEYKKGDFYITTDSKKIDIDAVSSLLGQSYWAKSRERDVITKSLKNSLCFSLFHNDKQIGLVRVITDYATFAYLCDVIIDDKYRHKGLGVWLLKCVFKYPDLQNLRRWCLATKDAHEFYRKFGFENLIKPEMFMEMINS
ncbi:GNAT family N-acetyltransferase [Clostridium thailandense]|uniref:GNAT family N-acetyltransferase n=1 Tax=Clostridium thailandense TaxID=2794346 RepID=A0A949TXC0_9CLOT|nr:GNAT family N-acetyltransferase [Clostridium thailandense]MBV7272189.1 GNAT family N-acetyltransferase [Clostridium thailandense]